MVKLAVGFPGTRAVALAVAALSAAAGGGPSLAAPATARVAADVSDTSTRVIVTFSKAVRAEVAAAPGRLEIACAEPVSFSPPESKLDDRLLAGWKTEGDRTLVLATGGGYRRFESFDLKNPSRIVVDLEGEASAPAARPEPRAGDRARRVIVLDPGHGGVETGAVGPSGRQEKDLTLDIARRLRRILEREAGVTVALTRDEDRFVSLDERAAVANNNRAELFVSIHLNASRRRGAVGAETYFLSPDATDDEARVLAALENRASGVEEPAAPAETTGGDRSLDLVLWDLAQNQYIAESGRLAESVQRELNALVGTKDRGIRQAPFRVLMGATMPAILVEAGFLTNPEEDGRLGDPAYLDRIADAVARAVGGYLASRDRLDGPGAAGR